MRIAAQIVILQDEMIHGIAIVAAEPVAPIVATLAVLSLARLRLEGAVIGPKAKIATADANHLTSLGGFDLAAAAAVGSVTPVVQSPDDTVQAMLRLALNG